MRTLMPVPGEGASPREWEEFVALAGSEREQARRMWLAQCAGVDLPRLLSAQWARMNGMDGAA